MSKRNLFLFGNIPLIVFASSIYTAFFATLKFYVMLCSDIFQFSTLVFLWLPDF